MKRSYFIMVPAAIAIICWVILEGGGRLGLFMDYLGMLLMIPVPLFMAMATYSPAEIVDCFAVAFRKEGADPAMIEKGIHFFSILQKYLIVAALLTFMIGFILIMATLEDLSRIGPYAAVAVVCIYYALALMLLVTIPFKAGLERKKIEMGG
jgi:hypothetical protein